MGCLFSMLDSTTERRPCEPKKKRRYSWSGSNQHTPDPFGDFSWLPKDRKTDNLQTNRCNICEAVFLERYMKDHHMKKFHDRATTGRIKCSECDSTFSRMQHLTRHFNIYHTRATPPVTCDICGKKFLHEGNLNRHKRLTHDGEKGYRCAKCPAVFARREDWEKHVTKGNHFTEYDCKFCKQTIVFKSIRQLDHHLLKSSGYSKVAYSCRYKKYGKKDEKGIWHL